MSAEAPWELYDLAADRSETKNLAEENSRKVKELAALWEKQMTEFADLAKKTKPACQDPKEK